MVVPGVMAGLLISWRASSRRCASTPAKGGNRLLPCCVIDWCFPWLRRHQACSPPSPAQVPSVAFEDVFYKDNTSVLQEEVLAHRLGLIPLAVDPEMLDAKGPTDPPTALNTLVFTLDVTDNPTGVPPSQSPRAGSSPFSLV